MCDLVDVHVDQFVGPLALPYATSTPAVSLGHTILSVTETHVVEITQLFMVNDHNDGAVLST